MAAFLKTERIRSRVEIPIHSSEKEKALIKDSALSEAVDHFLKHKLQSGNVIEVMETETEDLEAGIIEFQIEIQIYKRREPLAGSVNRKSYE